MPQDRFNLTGRAALLAAIAAAYPVIGYTAPAAQVDFAVGNVTAVGSNGQSRALGKGAQVEQGDTVNTNGGRAQLRFTDGAYVSLQPESQFRIDQYRFEGKQDGNEKGFFSLLKGGLRTITGLVGRSNKKSYQVSTSVATIGIRGTEYTIQYGNSVTGTVGEGQIEVCNGGGCLSVTNGESYYVLNQEVKPVLTNKRTDLPPPEPTNPPTNFTQGNNVDSTGNPIGFLLTGSQAPISIGRVAEICGVFCTPSSPGTVVLDQNGSVTDLNGALLSNVSMSGNDGIIAWGHGFSVSSGEILHFVVGLPTPSADILSLQLAKTVASYSLIGSTQPTIFSSGQSTGTLTGATLKVDFGNNLVSASVNLLANGVGINAGANNMILNSFSGSTFNSLGSASNFCNATSGSCSASMAGILAGANAIRAGLVYDVSHSDANGSANIIGAAAFAKNH
jgi:FecR protein